MLLVSAVNIKFDNMKTLEKERSSGSCTIWLQVTYSSCAGNEVQGIPSELATEMELFHMSFEKHYSEVTND